jgi:hypothetical protein
MPIVVFTMDRSRCSRCADLAVHVGPIWAFSMDRNPHSRQRSVSWRGMPTRSRESRRVTIGCACCSMDRTGGKHCRWAANVDAPFEWSLKKAAQYMLGVRPDQLGKWQADLGETIRSGMALGIVAVNTGAAPRRDERPPERPQGLDRSTNGGARTAPGGGTRAGSNLLPSEHCGPSQQPKVHSASSGDHPKMLFAN